ncbi:MAG: Bug family tripartite tricarboxylate transporter substrate binding protein [Burkholderiales bacterium]
MRMAIVACACVAVSLATQAQEQSYPSKPVKIIVPYPPGGADRLVRVVADRLRERLSQPFVVENRAGAAGNIGAEEVFRSAPDGYTLMASAPGVLVTNKALFAQLRFDPDMFVPVTVISTSPNVLAVNPKSPSDTVQKLIAYGKANSEKLNYGSAGGGSTPHLAAELFKALSATKIAHIPYKGTAPALTDLFGGQLDILFVEFASALPHIRGGKLRALGVGSEKRNALLPEIPALNEVLPGFSSTAWFAIVAPPATSITIANRLSQAVAEALKQPEMALRLSETGVEAVGSTPTQMAAFLKQERERWSKVIRESGITAE